MRDMRRRPAESVKAPSDTAQSSLRSWSAATKLQAASHIPILITCRDRLEALRDLVAWLEGAGQERIVFVDNASTFDPLLSYYRNTPHQVIRLEENVGHLAAWEANVLETIGYAGPYVVTDCDIVPAADTPSDALEYFAELLFRYGDVDKVGFGLHIDDLPASYQFRSDVIDWESQFWEHEVEPGVYRANIDTTFALYRASVKDPTYRALRTGPPYVARHIPWYADTEHPTEEDLYYQHHAAPGVGNWGRTQLPEELRGEIEVQRTTAAALATERNARQALEAELAAIRSTRSYRWTEPARKLRAVAANDLRISRMRERLRPGRHAE